jgi:hypothetical protein
VAGTVGPWARQTQALPVSSTHQLWTMVDRFIFLGFRLSVSEGGEGVLGTLHDGGVR